MIETLNNNETFYSFCDPRYLCLHISKLVSRLVPNDGISTSDEISAQTFFANDYSSAQTFFANVYPRNINVDCVIVDGGIG